MKALGRWQRLQPQPGGSYRLNEAWRLGLAAGFYEQSLEAGDADSDYELNSYIGTAFAQYQENPLVG